MDTLAILGGGKIGEALLSGLLRAGRSTDDVVISEKHPERAAYLAAKHAVLTASVEGALGVAHTILIAVKPQDMDSLLDQMRPYIRPGHVIVSVAAGVTTAHIERGLGASVAV